MWGVERKPPSSGDSRVERMRGGRKPTKVPGGRKSQGSQGPGILGGFLACSAKVDRRGVGTGAII